MTTTTRSASWALAGRHVQGCLENNKRAFHQSCPSPSHNHPTQRSPSPLPCNAPHILPRTHVAGLLVLVLVLLLTGMWRASCSTLSSTRSATTRPRPASTTCTRSSRTATRGGALRAAASRRAPGSGSRRGRGCSSQQLQLQLLGGRGSCAGAWASIPTMGCLQPQVVVRRAAWAKRGIAGRNA